MTMTYANSQFFGAPSRPPRRSTAAELLDLGIRRFNLNRQLEFRTVNYQTGPRAGQEMAERRRRLATSKAVSK